MAISKITYKSSPSATPETWMDATGATAAASDITSPKTAMLADGVVTTGTGSTPTGTKQISITENGTTTEDVAAYANAEIAVNVQGGGTGEWTTDGILDMSEPSGDLVTTLTEIGEYTLRDRINITSLIAPNATRIGGNACENCTGLEKIVIGGSNATWGAYAVRGCSALKEIHVPRASSLFGFGGYGLSGCTALELIDYGAANALQFNSLTVCPLHTIIIRKSNGLASLVANSLNNSTAFQSGGTGGTVYIHETYYNHLGDGSNLDYKNATNWSIYEGYGTITWAKIEGSEYEL